MEYFEYMKTHGYEQVVLCQEPRSGLKAVIAIHNTTLGPALGGCRMWKYTSEEEAIMDALRLARGMTYKSAAAGLNFGGGKSVIIGDPRSDKTEALFRALGRYVQSLNGRYIVAEDVGTCVEDMDYVRVETPFVAGTQGASGDPSPATAYGVWHGMKACAREAFGSESLEGRTVAVQGVGSVGYSLCRRLAEEGAHLVVTDLNSEAVRKVVKKYQAKWVEPEEIYGVDCDIFAPCALGAVLNDRTIPLLKARVVAGSANNVLAEGRHGELLAEKGVLYAPDFIINAGGVINIAHELDPAGYDRDRAFRQVAKIGQTVSRVIALARQHRAPTFRAAETLAEERIARLQEVKRSYVKAY